MRLFREAFYISREDKAIFRGFGLSHGEDVAALSPALSVENQGRRVAVSQPQGEGALLLRALLCGEESVSGGIYYDKENDTVLLDLTVGDTWRQGGVFPKDAYRYLISVETFSFASADGLFNSYGAKIRAACYGKGGQFLEGGRDAFTEFGCLPPCFAVLMAQQLLSKTGDLIENTVFFDKPEAVGFVSFCEDMYQRCRDFDYFVDYADISDEFEDVGDLKKIKLAPGDVVAVKKTAPAVSTALKGKARAAAEALQSGRCCSLLIVGEPLSGKSKLCRKILEEMGDLSSAVLVLAALHAEKSILTAFDGRNPLYASVKNGGAVVIDDFHLLSPCAAAWFGALCRGKNGIVPHEKFMLIALAETRPSQSGLFELQLNLPVPDTKVLSSYLRRHVPFDKKVEQAVAVYFVLKNGETGVKLNLNARVLSAWVSAATAVGYMAAAELTLIPHADGDQSIENLIRNILAAYAW